MVRVCSPPVPTQAVRWDLATGEVLHEWDHDGAFAVAPTGQNVVWYDREPGRSFLQDVSDSQGTIHSLPSHRRVHFSSDGSRFRLVLADQPIVGQAEGGAPETIYESRVARLILAPWRFGGQFSPEGRMCWPWPPRGSGCGTSMPGKNSSVLGRSPARTPSAMRCQPGPPSDRGSER